MIRLMSAPTFLDGVGDGPPQEAGQVGVAVGLGDGAPRPGPQLARLHEELGQALH